MNSTTANCKTALICGVTGQDGAYLAENLLARGYRVVGTSRDVQMSSLKNLLHLNIDQRIDVTSMALNDFRSVLQVLARVRPDEVYNLAGQSSVGLSFEQPVETLESISIGALNLLEALRFLDIGSRLYNAGSSECFGNTDGEPANELTRFSPRSPYGVAKAAAHWQVANYRESYGIFACSGILFNHESPLRPERFVTQKIIRTACRIAAGSNETLSLGNIEIERDWGWAPEYVEAMWLMLQQPEPQDYVIATGTSCKLSTFVEVAFDALNLDWRRHVIHDSNLLRPSDIKTSRADPSKAEKQLNWSARIRGPEVARRMIVGIK